VYVCPLPWLDKRYAVMPLRPPESTPVVTHLVAQRARARLVRKVAHVGTISLGTGLSCLR